MYILSFLKIDSHNMLFKKESEKKKTENEKEENSKW